MHGANGIWGVIAVGLFADGKSNYGGPGTAWPASVTGLFYGDAGQLVAQLIGVADAARVLFSAMGFAINLVHRIDDGPARVGQRWNSKA